MIIPTKNVIRKYIRNNAPVSANQINENMGFDMDNRTMRYRIKELLDSGEIVATRSLRDARVWVYLPVKR